MVDPIVRKLTGHGIDNDSQVYGDILYDKAAAEGIRGSVNAVLKSGVRPPDLGGKSSTTEVRR